MLTRFAPPGNLTDLTSNTALQAWSDNFIGRFVTSEINAVSRCVGNANVQFVDPRVRDLGSDHRVISWPAFPIALLRPGTSREQAMRRADDPNTGRDVQDEYLEWFIHRNAAGEMVAIDFTCEGPEYWGHLSRSLSRAAFARLYKIANPAANANDLFDASGSYNRRNRFNTTDGIMHLIHRNNTLGAEIDIVAQSTMRRNRTPVVSCLRCRDTNAIGGARRRSDPTIATNVNQLAADGRAITLLDPVGLYIGGLDTAGWRTPDNSNPQALFRIVRGNPGVRARFEVPGNRFPISDIRIGSEPIRFAGQIAEHISIQVTAIVGPRNEFTQRPIVPCTTPPAPLAAAAAREVAVEELPGRATE